MPGIDQSLADVARSTRQAVENLTRRIKAQEVKEAAVASLGAVSSTYANLGTGVEGQHRKCTDCRKAAEGPGAGTGQIVYWNPATTQWLNVRNDAAAAA